jgi:hypothetical protein
MNKILRMEIIGIIFILASISASVFIANRDTEETD